MSSAFILFTFSELKKQKTNYSYPLPLPLMIGWAPLEAPDSFSSTLLLPTPFSTHFTDMAVLTSYASVNHRPAQSGFFVVVFLLLLRIVLAFNKTELPVTNHIRYGTR